MRLCVHIFGKTIYVSHKCLIFSEALCKYILQDNLVPHIINIMYRPTWICLCGSITISPSDSAAH